MPTLLPLKEPASNATRLTARSPIRTRLFPGRHVPLAAVVLLGALLLAPFIPSRLSAAEIRHDQHRHSWSLVTGPVEYRLGERDGRVALLYFGPAGEPDWPAPKPRLRDYARFDTAGQVEGQYLRPEELELVSAKTDTTDADRPTLRLLFRHRHIPLELEATYVANGDTGVVTRQLTFTNRGKTTLAMEQPRSLAWLLPPADYTLSYLHGGWGEERQLATERIGDGTRAFVNTTGRSTNGGSPWFCVRDENRGLRYAAQLAYSGNWEMSFEHYTERRQIPLGEQDLWIELGMRFDFGMAAPLAPGKSFALPAVAFTASDGDLDAIANQMHRYQRRYVMPKSPANIPLVTQLNTFVALGRSPYIEDLKRYVDHAADLGLECMGTDACWIVKNDKGNTLYGDWREDPVGFPNGIEELANYVHAKGLKFSVWLEPETVSRFAPMALKHPEWILRHNGEPMFGTLDRVFIDFRRDDVRAWMRSVVDRLVRDVGVDWLKLDYNADVGEAFDPSGEGERTGTVLHDHLEALYAWIDDIRHAYPNLIIENCSSGALRFDLALLARTHFSWRSDITLPRSSMQLTYGATIEFPAEASYHWMAGETQKGAFDPATPRGWWDFMFRADMNGLFGIAGRIDDWTPEMRQCARENVRLYKRIRTVIQGADIYHLTPPPAAGEHPTGWMTLQYATPDTSRAVVMAYRLADSEPRQTYRLRGLSPSQTYTITIDGSPPGAGEPRRLTGRELATSGLAVSLNAEWRAAVIELTATPN